MVDLRYEARYFHGKGWRKVWGRLLLKENTANESKPTT